MRKIIVLCLVLMTMFSCSFMTEKGIKEGTKKALNEKLPTGAKDFEYIGNGWGYFTLDNNKFIIFYKLKHMCLTQIVEE